MPRREAVNDLLREGCRSYAGARYAVRQFEEQVQGIIRGALKDRATELAAALRLTRAQLAGELTTRPGESDGSHGWFWVQNRKNEIGWCLYFGFEIRKNEASFYAQVWLPKRRDVLLRLQEASKDVVVEGSYAWILQAIDTEGTLDMERSFRLLLDRWIALWRKVGGLRQFLPKSQA